MATVLALWAGCGSITALPGGQADGGQLDGRQLDGGPVERPAEPRRRSGVSCNDGAECESGFCADGVCCRTACRAGCVSCNQEGRAGICWPIDLGEPDPHGLCADQGPASCGTTGTCDGFGGCTKYGPGAVCSPARCVGGALDTACAAPGVCIGGACRPLPSVLLTPAGATPAIGGSYRQAPADDHCPAGTAVVGLDVTATSDESPYIGRIRTICGKLAVATDADSVTIELGATTALPERGTKTGTTTSLRCPKNQVVVGYDGRSGAWVDQLSFRCAPLLVTNGATAIVLGPVTTIGPVGGNGGGPHGETDCGPEQISVGSRSVAEPFLMQLSLSCATVSLL